MNKLKRLILIYLFVCLNCIASAQTLSKNYPFLRKVAVIAEVVSNSSGGYFYYCYSLENDRNNTGRIEEFQIDISRDPNSVEYDTVGLKFDTGNGDWEERQFREEYPRLASYIVPIGISQLPPYWSSVWGNQWIVSISNVHEAVSGGTKVDGTIIMSKGLPGIRWFVVKPEFQDALYFPSIEDTSANAMTTAQMDSIREAVNFHGWTIGPTAPPMDFNALVYLDTLISYKHQAVAFGWIDNQGIANSLDQKLESAKSQLQNANTNAAKNILHAFVSEVEAQKGKHLTSEAYALLKFNAEYLLSKL